ncbi:MAG: rhodanese-like domain-containing protein [Lautropia sp.]|nr:rhodanese-like domain-containing protein [Lautropia sp.]
MPPGKARAFPVRQRNQRRTYHHPTSLSIRCTVSATYPVPQLRPIGKILVIMQKSAYLNLAAYQFTDLDNLPALRSHLQSEGDRLDMRGTILLTPEGINIMLSGPENNARAFCDILRAEPALARLHIKESLSNTQSFNRFLVKIKRETITFRQPDIRPADGRAATVSPDTLARWLDAGHDDEGRALAVIDTRNDFEIEVGHFHNAINPHIHKFTDLPAALESHRPALVGKRIVTYCTGGIRCEKAALWMSANGYEHVVQLDGGVLDYFQQTGGRHWDGELFVFDRRVSLTPQLQPGSWTQDFQTRTVHPAHDTSNT